MTPNEKTKHKLFRISSFCVAGIYLYLSLTAIPIGSDMGRIWYFSKLFLDGNLNSAFRTLEPFLAVSINALFLGTFGVWFPLISIQGVASALTVLLISSFILKNYGTRPAFISLLLFLSSYIFLDRSTDMVPYPLFSFLVSLGMILFIKYQDEQKAMYLFLSALLISISIFIFNLPISTLGIVLAFYLLSLLGSFRKRFKSTVKSLMQFYLVSLVLLTPWFIWRFSRAGLNFYKNPIHWLSEKYWSKFNVILWDRPRPLSLEYFDYFLTVGLKNLMGPLLFLCFAWFGLYRIRHRLIYVLWALVPIIPIVLGKLPTEARYLYTSLPPLIILASIGFSEILNTVAPGAKKIIGYLFVISAFLTIVSNFQTYSDVYDSNVSLANEVIALRSNFTPGETVFFRSLQFQGVFPENPMIAPQYMEEDDAVTFVSWESPEKVTGVIQKYSIDWILLYRENKLEREFSGWIQFVDPALSPRHYIEISKSDMVTKHMESENFVLYRIKNK